MASAEREPIYNEGMGAEPPAGYKGRAPGHRVSGDEAPEAESLLTFQRPMKAEKLPIDCFFCKLTVCDVCIQVLTAN